MNLSGTTPQIKRSGATFMGNLTADGLFDRQDSAYFIDPKATIASGNLSGTFTVGGNVGIGTTNTATYALNILGNANATQLCIAGDCKSVWPSAPAETDPKVAGGSPNYLTKWTGATALGASAIYDNGNVGIGTTNPSARLHVSGGSVIVDNGLNFATKNVAGLQANLIGTSGNTVQIGSNGLGDIIFLWWYP